MNRDGLEARLAGKEECRGILKGNKLGEIRIEPADGAADSRGIRDFDLGFAVDAASCDHSGSLLFAGHAPMQSACPMKTPLPGDWLQYEQELGAGGRESAPWVAA
jgi:hypothetical protein